MIYCYYLQIISIIIRQTLNNENKKKYVSRIDSFISSYRTMYLIKWKF